jgi:Flp pilus assembly protein TadB
MSSRPGARPPARAPVWALVTVVILAIIFAIIAGVLWYYLQACRKAAIDNPNSNCPQVLPATCCKVDSSGNTLPACTTKCSQASDCPSYAPNCNSGTCGM